MTKKKMALSIGSMLVITAPVVALVSCSSSTSPVKPVDPVYGEYTTEQVDQLNQWTDQEWKDGQPKFILNEQGLKTPNPKFGVPTGNPVVPPVEPDQPNTQQQSGVTAPELPLPPVSLPSNFWDNVQDNGGDWKFLKDENGNDIIGPDGSKTPNPAFGGERTIDDTSLEILSDYGLSLGNGILETPRTLPIPAWDFMINSDEEIIYMWAANADVSSLESLRIWKVNNITVSAVKRIFGMTSSNTLISPRNVPTSGPDGIAYSRIEVIILQWLKIPGSPADGPTGRQVSIYDARSFIQDIGSTPYGSICITGDLVAPLSDTQVLMSLGIMVPANNIETTPRPLPPESRNWTREEKLVYQYLKIPFNPVSPTPMTLVYAQNYISTYRAAHP